MPTKPNVIVLSGFLGSGKTTVLLQLVEHLRKTHGDDYTVAIIENEIGSAPVDSGALEQAGYSVTEMLSGCVCCTLLGKLVPAMNKLTEQLNPQLIILEATGMATPEPLRRSIATQGGYPTRIVTLVDASRWSRIFRAMPVLLEEQVIPANVLCVNKMDLAGDDARQTIEESLRAMNATAPLVWVSANQPLNPTDLNLLAGD